jgi:HlyD family secretion protein
VSDTPYTVPAAAREPAAEVPHDGALSQRVRSLRLPSQHAGGGSRLGWIAWVLCFLFAGSTAVLGYLLATQKPAAEAGAEDKDASAAAAASFGVPPPGDIALQAKGYVIPAHQILVSPKVSGEIETLSFREGQPVKKDFELATLVDTEYRADFNRAEFAVQAAENRYMELKQGYRQEEKDQADRELKEAQEQLAQLKDVYDRNQKLGPAVASEQDLRESESKYKAMLHRVERFKLAKKLMDDGPREERRKAALAEWEQAKAERVKAEKRLKDCKILAPISGTILKKNAEVGNLVNPIAFAGSTSLCDMADLSKLEIEVSVQERDLHLVHNGQQCQVWAEAFPHRKFTGRARLMPIADRGKGAVFVRVEVLDIPKEEEGVYLKPDMGAMVLFWKDKTDAGAAVSSARPPLAP